MKRLMPREQLTANRNYYVRLDGSDANDGKSKAKAFKTVGKAISVIEKLDWYGFFCTLNLGPGEHGGPHPIPAFVGMETANLESGAFEVRGEGDATKVSLWGRHTANVYLADLCLHNLNGAALKVGEKAEVILGTNVSFGADGECDIFCYDTGLCSAFWGYGIRGGKAAHFVGSDLGSLHVTGQVKAIGTPHYSYIFKVPDQCHVSWRAGSQTVGTVLGQKILQSGSGVVNGDTSTMPGS